MARRRGRRVRQGVLMLHGGRRVGQAVASQDARRSGDHGAAPGHEAQLRRRCRANAGRRSGRHAGAGWPLPRPARKRSSSATAPVRSMAIRSDKGARQPGSRHSKPGRHDDEIGAGALSRPPSKRVASANVYCRRSRSAAWASRPGSSLKRSPSRARCHRSPGAGPAGGAACARARARGRPGRSPVLPGA